MKIYMIRHSEPDYEPVNAAGYVGYGRDLSRLTVRGVEMVQKISESPIFEEIQVLLASPYTRTMQTALEIARVHNLPVEVELLLHEWRPDKTGKVLENYQQVRRAYADYKNQTNLSGMEFETGEEIIARVSSVFEEYKKKYTCIACVTHAEVIRVFTGKRKVGYCEIVELEY